MENILWRTVTPVNICVLLLFFLGSSYGQFPNFFQRIMSGGSSASDGCQNSGISCLPAPWCTRTRDENGCTKCECGNAKGPTSGSQTNSTVVKGLGPVQSFSPFNSGYGGPMSLSLGGVGGQVGPINPMANMFGGGSMIGGGMGGPSGMMSLGQTHENPIQNTNDNCGPAPYTCSVPPPWCQRVIDSEGCVQCLCGTKLTAYMQDLAGVTTPTPQTTTAPPSETTLSTILKTSAVPTTLYPPLDDCLINFRCTLSCDTGYQTDSRGCPVCSCEGDIQSETMTNTPSQLPVDSSSSSSLLSSSSSSAISSSSVDTQNAQTTATGSSLSVDNSILMCPGIFDCDKICMTGYESDAIGCPICQCADA